MNNENISDEDRNVFYRNVIGVQCHALGTDDRLIEDIGNASLVSGQPLCPDGFVHIYISILFNIFVNEATKVDCDRKLK